MCTFCCISKKYLSSWSWCLIHPTLLCCNFPYLQVRVLFSKGPFISIFASDPHIIIKAINQNLNSVLRDSNINGHDYMRNIVHLPVFLNSRGLSSAKKMCTPAPANGDTGNSEGQWYCWILLVWKRDLPDTVYCCELNSKNMSFFFFHLLCAVFQ